VFQHRGVPFFLLRFLLALRTWPQSALVLCSAVDIGLSPEPKCGVTLTDQLGRDYRTHRNPGLKGLSRHPDLFRSLACREGLRTHPVQITSGLTTCQVICYSTAMLFDADGAAKSVLFWAGGAATTVAGSWITSRFRVYEDARKAHHQDIKDRVLKHIHGRLMQPAIANAVYGRAAAVSVVRLARDPTEENQTEYEEVLLAGLPEFGLTKGADTVLLSDARQNHLPELVKQLYEFMAALENYAGQCQKWCLQIASQLVRESGLPAFPPLTRPGWNPYVMHHRIAVIIHQHISGMPAPELRMVETGGQWLLVSSGTNVAIGEKRQIETLLNIAHEFERSKAEQEQAELMQQLRHTLSRKYNTLVSDFEYAIASQRLLKQCNLVPFF
jgi:hypothetical protein